MMILWRLRGLFGLVSRGHDSRCMVVICMGLIDFRVLYVP